MRGGVFLVGAAIADVHLSQFAPFSRPSEDWYEQMARPLRRVRQIVDENKAHPHDNVPIFCAGDLFDRYGPPAELIGFAMRTLPRMVAVPGNHDLPYHSMEHLHRSAFNVLVQANIITMPLPAVTTPVNDHISVTCYPCGYDSLVSDWRPSGTTLTGFHVALIHEYCWTDGKSFPGAPGGNHVKRWAKKLRGNYRIAVFGDNHQAFKYEEEGLTIVNCGSLMRRKSDEAAYEPSVWLIWSDASVTRKKLNVKEKVRTPEQVVDKLEKGQGFEEFIHELQAVASETIDFWSVVDELMVRRKVRLEIRQRILKALEKK